MKVLSFTGAAYATRTHQHRMAFPDKQSVINSMSIDDINVINDITDFRFNKDEIALTFEDAANTSVTKFLAKSKIPFVVFPDVSSLSSLNKKALNAILR